eukprot:CAMPEP_0170512474 /NCGR_PEP_ID=MMETSP0208-20121228/66870_1 /TAXON_ID=197538 /ORGANISM="Strombidium inclinatum, Strain S3" /LENGTH=131 /DNA_ID=CAMNT_0010796107 /DNA_START=1519 /DNA_END=1914 /DNA_ORIENTATION=+
MQQRKKSLMKKFDLSIRSFKTFTTATRRQLSTASIRSKISNISKFISLKLKLIKQPSSARSSLFSELDFDDLLDEVEPDLPSEEVEMRKRMSVLGRIMVETEEKTVVFNDFLELLVSKLGTCFTCPEERII